MRDLRSAWRALRQSPVLSAAAILSLALGMGANTALFSVVDALLLRTLPVRQPDRLVTVSSGFALGHGFKAGAGMNYDIWTRMRERARRCSTMALPGPPSAWTFRTEERCSPRTRCLPAAGSSPRWACPRWLGRTFTPVDDQKGGGPEGWSRSSATGLWQRRFAGAADVIGTALPVDGVPCIVIGVMPPEFFGIEVGQPFDVVLPLAVEPDVRGARARCTVHRR